jgi:Ulp1 family protease
MTSSNSQAAHDVADMFQSMLSRTITLIDCQTPQQQNGYDCGLHTLAAIEALLPLENVESKEKFEHAAASYLVQYSCRDLRLRIARDIREAARTAQT